MEHLTNYHSHSLFCDGRASMEDFVRFAINQQFSSYGISSHAPLPFSTPWTMEWDDMDAYLSDFQRVKKLYREKIELILGLEIDYLDEQSNPSSSCFQTLPLDYAIGSVHLIKNANEEVLDLDVSPTHFAQLVNTHFNGNLKEVITLYYESQFKMLRSGGFNILGHADKIYYNASHYSPDILTQDWYNDLVYSCLKEAVDRDYIIEINTKAYHQLGISYPRIDHLKYLVEIGAKLQVNSDAHYPDRINNGRLEMIEQLKTNGLRALVEWHNGAWVEVPL